MPDITSLRLGEQYTLVEHQSGLRLLLCPMKEFSTAYAIFAAKIGSVDDAFSLDGGPLVEVPMGIAHFLEHKLFESEKGDAFAQYAKTGASANAFTSFDRTAYLFSCTDNFTESLDVLLELVTHPYFTEQTVQKEQGIIGQEIRMYEDDPDWRVMFNLLGALYHRHPLRHDIAGTVDSIAEITADVLHQCYRAFYNPHNMVLAVAGNFSPQDVIAACDRLQFPVPPSSVETRHVDEPQEIVTRRVEQTLEVAAPLFEIGFKGIPGSHRENMLAQIAGGVVCDLLAGESTALYRRLYDEGLINGTFGSEIFAGPSYIISLFSGESHDPDAVFARLCEEIERMQTSGINPEDFERAKRAAYGHYAGMYGSVEAMASLMVLTAFSDLDAYKPLDCLAELTINEAQAFLREHFDVKRAALSVIVGANHKD